jgi:hypothetical protein
MVVILSLIRLKRGLTCDGKRGILGEGARGDAVRYLETPHFKHYIYRVYFPCQCDRQHPSELVRGCISLLVPNQHTIASTSYTEPSPARLSVTDSRYTELEIGIVMIVATGFNKGEFLQGPIAGSSAKVTYVATVLMMLQKSSTHTIAPMSHRFLVFGTVQISLVAKDQCTYYTPRNYQAGD